MNDFLDIIVHDTKLRMAPPNLWQWLTAMQLHADALIKFVLVTAAVALLKERFNVSKDGARRVELAAQLLANGCALVAMGSHAARAGTEAAPWRGPREVLAAVAVSFFCFLVVVAMAIALRSAIRSHRNGWRMFPHTGL